MRKSGKFVYINSGKHFYLALTLQIYWELHVGVGSYLSLHWRFICMFVLYTRAWLTIYNFALYDFKLRLVECCKKRQSIKKEEDIPIIPVGLLSTVMILKHNT